MAASRRVRKTGAARHTGPRMGKEIERKFLIAGQAWRQLATQSLHLIDGLVATAPGRKVRVRLFDEDQRATLTIKAKEGGRPGGIVDAEFEYPIPVADAQELLAAHCDGTALAKRRHIVPHRGFTWHVDVYEG